MLEKVPLTQTNVQTSFKIVALAIKAVSFVNEKSQTMNQTKNILHKIHTIHCAIGHIDVG